jgi:hypothetical protein
MADGVELNAGSGGATAATDDCGVAGHAQVVKLAISTDGSATLIPADNTNGIDVDVTRVSGTVTVDGSGVTQPVSHSALTELAAAINASSQLDVNIAASAATLTVASHAVTNAGTFAVQVDGNALTSLQLIDDPVATLGTTTYTEAATKGMIVGAVRRDADTTLVDTTNEVGPLQMDANGRLKVEVFSGETLPVSGTVTANLAAGTNNIGDVDVLSIAAGDNNIGNVDVVTLPNVTLAAGTNTNEVVGDAAHDAAAAGNPLYMGGYATNSIEGVTQVTAGDVTRQVHDLNGVQVVRPHTTLEECISERVTNTDGASTALTNFAAAGAGAHNYITQVTLWNSSATDGFVDLRDGTGGSVKWTIPAPQTGGCTISFDPPLKFGDNTAVAFDASAAISTIYLSFNGFQAQG